MTRRRYVFTSSITPRKGRPRLWAFGYADLAQLLGRSEAAVRQLVARGRIDPRDLASVCAAWRARRP